MTLNESEIIGVSTEEFKENAKRIKLDPYKAVDRNVIKQRLDDVVTIQHRAWTIWGILGVIGIIVVVIIGIIIAIICIYRK